MKPSNQILFIGCFSILLLLCALKFAVHISFVSEHTKIFIKNLYFIVLTIIVIGYSWMIIKLKKIGK
jgi:hypothetical protein